VNLIFPQYFQTVIVLTKTSQDTSQDFSLSANTIHHIYSDKSTTLGGNFETLLNISVADNCETGDKMHKMTYTNK